MPQLESYLLEKKLITLEQLDHAKALSNSQKKPLSIVLEELMYVAETDILKFFAAQFNLEFSASLQTIELTQEKINSLPLKRLKEHSVAPLFFKNKLLKVATANPLSLDYIDTLRSYFEGATVEIVIAPKKTIETLLNKLFSQKELSLKDDLKDWQRESRTEKQLPPAQLLSSDTPLLKIVDQIISEAIKIKATDIHFQPNSNDVSLKYRLDGLLYKQQSLEVKLYSEVVSRIKVISKLDITQTRKPQDGRFSFDGVPGKSIDVRVSLIPTSWGERIVLRLLNKENLFVPWENLGFSPEGEAIVKKHIFLNNGMILVNGPTGAGKTTTLYSCLDRINNGVKNIITIEDPIEYDLSGISQMNLNQKIDVSFSNALRAVLRQDPDVIMIGEIRDLETATIAIRSALTGHLVFSTLHANDTLQSIIRLIDIGIEPYLITAAISLLIAQRLIRVLCPHCKQKATREEISAFKSKHNVQTEFNLYTSLGCPQCLQTGFKGRIALYEILELNDDLKIEINKGKSYQHLQNYLRENSYFSSLRQEGLKKIMAGITTEKEVMLAVNYL